MTVVLDTSFLIDLSKHHAPAQSLLQQLKDDGELLLVPAVVAAEYLGGFANPAKALDALQQGAQVLPFEAADALAAAHLARAARASGRFQGWPDAMIAGFALERSAPVVTGNPRHFPGVPTRTY